LSSAGGAEMLPRRDAGDRLAEIRQVLGCLSMQAAEHHDAVMQVTCNIIWSRTY